MESAENRKQPMSNNELGNDVLSKTETLKLLNDSIDRLEQTIKAISQDSATVPSDSIKTLTTTTQELADAVTFASPEPESTLPETKIEPAPIEAKSAPPKVKTSPKQTEPLTEVKAQKKKSLILITICVAAIAIAIVAVFQIWLPKQQSTISSASESIASAPEPTITEIPNLNSQLDRALEAPLLEPTQLDDSQSDIEPIVVDLPTANEPTVESETIAEIIPPDLESPGRAKNLKMVEIEPKLSFTPEQTLIAALQSKVANLTQDYPSEAIASVRVDIPQSSLAVEVTDSWYELSESEQTKLANEMLRRSRQLDFTKLELKDSEGTLVARNPVIGEKIIILQNSKEDEPLEIDNL